MTTNVLVPLPGFVLPPDLPWRIRFIEQVENHLRTMQAKGHFRPPRFFGYYFRNNDPVAVSGNWTVMLEADPLLAPVPRELDRLTCGQFTITAPAGEDPEYMLIHDRHDGACWLWGFAYGFRFVTATSPFLREEAEED
ncbi:hypothetical protein MASR2M8_22900 [Opitutaceae bacterium]